MRRAAAVLMRVVYGAKGCLGKRPGAGSLVRVRQAASTAAVLVALATAGEARASLAHVEVEGHPLAHVEVGAKGGAAEAVRFGDLGARRTPGVWELRATWAGGQAVQVPHCAGRGAITLDGVTHAARPGPLVLALAPGASHELRFTVNVSKYEKRVACAEPIKVGRAARDTHGLVRVTFPSPAKERGGGEAVVYLPPTRDPTGTGPLLVGVHPWNGTPWTYAAYAELLDEARARGVALLMPSGLGNSLYVRDAEEEVMRAIDHAATLFGVDPSRTSIWGASMGGGGATTIGFHRPDRFALVVSFFGDAKFDVHGYTRAILRDEAGARLVNPIDVIDNARHVPVWLIHGEADRTSPITESETLDAALRARGYTVEFDRVPGAGHEGPLIQRFARRVVARAAEAVTPAHPPRVTFRSVRREDTRAYGVTITRSGGGDSDAFVDLAARSGGLTVLRAEGVSAITLAEGALGLPRGAPVTHATASRPKVTWEAP